MEHRIIAVDFDGTLFETDYPQIVRPIRTVIDAVRDEQKNGAKLILWTCREGKELEEAVKACMEQGLVFDAINDNLPEMKEKWGNNPRKIAATEYWDDRAWEAIHTWRFSKQRNYMLYTDEKQRERAIQDLAEYHPLAATQTAMRYLLNNASAYGGTYGLCPGRGSI